MTPKRKGPVGGADQALGEERVSKEGAYQPTLSTYAVNAPPVTKSTPTWLAVTPAGTVMLTTFHEPFNKFVTGVATLVSVEPFFRTQGVIVVSLLSDAR
jgi:hypothetical protein